MGFPSARLQRWTTSAATTWRSAPAPTSETPAVEAVLLRRQVQRIGSNLNQACRRLHALDGGNAAAVAAVERAADAVGRFLEAVR